MTRHNIASVLSTAVVSLLFAASMGHVSADSGCHAREDGICLQVTAPDSLPLVLLTAVPPRTSDCHAREDGICLHVTAPDQEDSNGGATPR